MGGSVVEDRDLRPIAMVVDFARIDGVHQALGKTQDAGASVDRRTVSFAVAPMFAYMTTALCRMGIIGSGYRG